MYNLRLTEPETEKLEQDKAVYCFRDKSIYLVEKEDFSNGYKVTVFNAPVYVIKSHIYQTSMKY